MIVLEDIRKNYLLRGDEVGVLNNVSLNVKKGEFVSVMGPSGSGKSTLMNILGCLDKPDSGTYMLDGHDINTMSDRNLALLRRYCIGFIFQSFNLLPDLTAMENVELPLLYCGTASSERKKRASELLDYMKLGDRMLHRPTELSGGQKQRVAIARALICNPPLLLADEPTGNLDFDTGSEIMQLLKTLNSSGITILLITHERRIASFADKCMLLSDGRLVQQ